MMQDVLQTFELLDDVSCVTWTDAIYFSSAGCQDGWPFVQPLSVRIDKSLDMKIEEIKQRN